MNYEQFNNQNNVISGYVPNKSNNKKIVFIILAIILIGIGIGAFFLFKDKNNSNEIISLNSVFDPNKPIIIKQDGKYGYITSDGEAMTEVIYKSASEFRGDYAVVAIVNPDTTSSNKNIYQIIDKKGNVMNGSTEMYSAPKYYQEYDIWYMNNAIYNSKLNKISSEGIKIEDYISNGYFEYENEATDESGIINHQGKIVFTWAGTYIYTDMSDNDYVEDDLYIRVTSSDERDLVVSLKTGKIVYTLANPDKNHLYVEDNNIIKEFDDDYNCIKRMFFINGELAYETTEDLYDFEVYSYENQILELDYGYDYEELGKSQRRYYYDVKNKKLLTEKPTVDSSVDLDNIDLTELTYGYKEFSSSGKYGLMQKDSIVIPCEYDDINFVGASLFEYMKNSRRQELVFLEKDDTTILMNLKNKRALTTFASTSMYTYDNSTFIRANIYTDGNLTNYVIYNLVSGNSMTIDKDEKFTVNSNYITITKDNKKTYYNTKLEQIYVEEL